MQIGQGESLVHFLCPALPNRPHQTVVVVNERAGRFISNALFAELAKKRF